MSVCDDCYWFVSGVTSDEQTPLAFCDRGHPDADGEFPLPDVLSCAGYLHTTCGHCGTGTPRSPHVTDSCYHGTSATLLEPGDPEVCRSFIEAAPEAAEISRTGGRVCDYCWFLRTDDEGVLSCTTDAPNFLVPRNESCLYFHHRRCYGCEHQDWERDRAVEGRVAFWCEGVERTATTTFAQASQERWCDGFQRAQEGGHCPECHFFLSRPADPVRGIQEFNRCLHPNEESEIFLPATTTCTRFERRLLGEEQRQTCSDCASFLPRENDSVWGGCAVQPITQVFRAPAWSLACTQFQQAVPVLPKEPMEHLYEPQPPSAEPEETELVAPTKCSPMGLTDERRIKLEWFRAGLVSCTKSPLHILGWFCNDLGLPQRMGGLEEAYNRTIQDIDEQLQGNTAVTDSTCCAWHPSRLLLATGHGDGKVRVWEWMPESEYLERKGKALEGAGGPWDQGVASIWWCGGSGQELRWRMENGVTFFREGGLAELWKHGPVAPSTISHDREWIAIQTKLGLRVERWNPKGKS